MAEDTEHSLVAALAEANPWYRAWAAPPGPDLLCTSPAVPGLITATFHAMGLWLQRQCELGPNDLVRAFHIERMFGSWQLVVPAHKEDDPIYGFDSEDMLLAAADGTVEILARKMRAARWPDVPREDWVSYMQGDPFVHLSLWQHWRKWGYPAYLASPWWAHQRKQVLSKAPYCALCDHQAEEVHHSSYQWLWNNAELAKLTPLCQADHALHSRQGRKPRPGPLPLNVPSSIPERRLFFASVT